VRWVIRACLVLVLVGLAVAGLDFMRFVDRADRVVTAKPPADAQAITALTGASNARIVAGVKLSEDLNLPLLISGVHVDTRAADIAKIVGVTEGDIDCCVTLGRAAATTAGNGDEVADWARKRGYTRIIVVTSEYHMDRALLELRRAMPEGDFSPYAVPTTDIPPHDWYRNGATARRLIEEWAKYRVASLIAAQAAKSAASQSADHALHAGEAG
jgi:uncharacterized SAM-binding protein YcdF (DUF218 family)